MRAPLSSWAGPAIALALVALTAFHELDLIPAAAFYVGSLVVVSAGALWAMRGPTRLRSLSELYLWLAMILALYHLRGLTDRLARGWGVDELAVFQVAAIVHLGVVATVLWVLGAWTPRGRRIYGRPYLARLSAGLLVFGAVVFWVGARTFPGLTLEGMAENPGSHLWTSAGFALATVITLVGLGFLTAFLREAGDPGFSVLGLATFAFGAVFWILHLAVRMTVMPLAADEYALTGLPPPWYEPWRDWAGLLFGVFSVLAYLAIAAYGGAFLRTAVLPRAVGWAFVAVGLLAAPLVGPPFFIHVALWIVGLLLLRAGKPASTPGSDPPPRLFVYGSLAPGRPNQHVLGAVGGTWEPATVKGRLVEAGWGADMGYPVLVLDDDGDDIEGFIFSSETLAAHWRELDEFEGDEYQRTLVIAKRGGAVSTDAFVYVSRQPAPP